MIDLPADLGALNAVSTVTLAELASGLLAAGPMESAQRQARYLTVLRTMDPIPFTEPMATLYGGLCELVRSAGRNPRPRRLDLMIAATAAYLGIPLLTRKPADFEGIHESVQVIGVS